MYDYNLQHREGKQHANADAVSRCPDGLETLNKAVQCVVSSITLTDRDDNATSDIPEISLLKTTETAK